MHTLALATITVHIDFEVPSFTRSKDMVVPRF